MWSSVAPIAGVLLLLSWAAIGFAGLTGYFDLLRRLEDTIGQDAYTTYVMAVDLGASPGVARALSLAFGLILLTAVVWTARRGDERSAFILAIAAALALSPLVWLHYFAFLVVVVALAQPRLGALWFLPLVMFVCPGRGNPTLLETAVALGAAALIIALALRERSEGLGRCGPTPYRSARLRRGRRDQLRCLGRRGQARGADRWSASVTGFLHDHVWSMAVWAAMIAWSAALFVVVRDRFVNYRLARYDLGNMVQAVWSTAEGRPLARSRMERPASRSFASAVDVDPILAALAPLWIVLPSPLTLVAVQVGAVALGALPVFWLGRRHLARRAAAPGRAGVPRLPLDRMDRGQRVPSGDARDPRSALRRLVPRLGPAPAVRCLRSPRHDDGRAQWESSSLPWESGTRSLEGEERQALR